MPGKPETSIRFQPLHFLRTHSKQNAPADVQTEIWDCAFEPVWDKPGHFTHTVATCGETSVCLINVQRGEILQKYNHDEARDIFYTLAWGKVHYQDDTSTMEQQSVVVFGGSQRKLTVIVPYKSKVVSSQKLPHFSPSPRTESLNTLLNHPELHNVFFLGLSSGAVLVEEISIKSGTVHLEKLQIFYHQDWEILQFAFYAPESTLMAATTEGLRAWKYGGKQKSGMLSGHEIKLPSPANDKPLSSVIDSVVILGSSLVATKRASESHILIWNFEDLVSRSKGQCVDKGLFLKWSETDNQYLKMGWNIREKSLVCGDDEGCLWYYDLQNLTPESLGPLNNPPLECSLEIPWPLKLRDPESDKLRKLAVSTYGIFVTKVTLAGPYIVATTRNNLVCIWKNSAEC